MTIDLTAIFQALIGLLASLVTVYVIPWIRAKTNAQQQAMLRIVVKTLVEAAEQLYKEPGTGAAKMDYVRNQLIARGFDFDKAAVEAAVRDLGITATLIDTLEVSTTTDVELTE